MEETQKGHKVKIYKKDIKNTNGLEELKKCIENWVYENFGLVAGYQFSKDQIWVNLKNGDSILFK